MEKEKAYELYLIRNLIDSTLYIGAGFGFRPIGEFLSPFGGHGLQRKRTLRNPDSPQHPQTHRLLLDGSLRRVHRETSQSDQDKDRQT
jgi:hypothetical protein